MKILKISLIALVAVIMTIGASSFKTQRPLTQKWFVYNGSGNTSATNYTEAPDNGADPQCPEDDAIVCSVFATDDGMGHPVQSELNTIASQSNNFQDPLPGLLEYKDQ